MSKTNFTYRYTDAGRETIFPSPDYEHEKTLPNLRYISVMVWNIFKQQRLDWLTLLEEHAKQRHFVLLQEAHSTQNLIDFATRNFLVADQVPAIELPNMTSGVMTLSKVQPVYCKAFRKNEPFLRLPKSALITLYQMHDGRYLMVINVHAVNFSLGVGIYREQIKSFAEHVMNHNGPVIFAGDFNTWSRARLHLLYQFTRRMGLRPVRFDNDERKNVFKHPLDFIFYRGLEVHSSEVIRTDASDHNPLVVTFKIQDSEQALSSSTA